MAVRLRNASVVLAFLSGAFLFCRAETDTKRQQCYDQFIDDSTCPCRYNETTGESLEPHTYVIDQIVGQDWSFSPPAGQCETAVYDAPWFSDLAKRTSMGWIFYHPNFFNKNYSSNCHTAECSRSVNGIGGESPPPRSAPCEFPL